MNIVVDRGSIMASHRAFQRSCDDIDNTSAKHFPWGQHSTGTLNLEIQNGPFKLAIEKRFQLFP